MPAWPSTLPQFVLEEGFSERMADQTIESRMETGPAKVRRRFTTEFRQFSVSLAMTEAQAEAFITFYLDDCGGGAISFTWVDPRSQSPRTFRFRLPAPSFRKRGEAVIASFRLESLP